jgi:CRISPR-associated protein Csd2
MDWSSARRLMATQGVWIFIHDSALGNYPTHKLFNLLKIESLAEYLRHFKDYQANMSAELPPGISLTYLN